MVKMTKQQLTDLFNGSKTWEEMSVEFTAQAGVEVTPKMVQELFKANGFNLRSRTRKSKDSWYTILDDSPVSSIVDLRSADITSEVELTEEFA